MILLLDNCILPNIEPDLSDLVHSYVKNICGDNNTYRNAVVDKYEMSKHWRVPFIDFVKISSNGSIDVKIGTYNFESIKRGLSLILVDSLTSSFTLYDFVGCPRNEHAIHLYDFGLRDYILQNVEAFYKNVGKCNLKNNDNIEYSNELFSFIFKFEYCGFHFEIRSDDIIHKLLKYDFDDVDKYKHRKADYKIDMYSCSQGWIDYGEARSVFNLIEYIREIDKLSKNGLKIQDIDFNTFGTSFSDGKIKNKFSGFYDFNELISSIACSNVREEDCFVVEFDNILSSKLIPYYRFLFENILDSQIFNSISGACYIRIRKEKFIDKDSILPFLIFNVMRNIDNDLNYTKYIHAKRYDSDSQYSKLISYIEPIRNKTCESRIADVLKIEAKNEYRVSYRTGDHDDVWRKEKYLKIVFNCDIDSATIYAIKNTIPGIKQSGQIFEYYKEESGFSDRLSVGYSENYSQEYKSTMISKLCHTIYSIYKSGVWNT